MKNLKSKFVFLSAHKWRWKWKILKKLNTYTERRFNFFIMWQARKMESVFKLKEKKAHPSHVIYKGKCICGQTYIGQTARNLKVRVNELWDVNKQSEPAKHIRKHPNNKFTWEVLSTAHLWLKRKIKEAFYIARFRQVQSLDLTLFPMGTGIT